MSTKNHNKNAMSTHKRPYVVLPIQCLLVLIMITLMCFAGTKAAVSDKSASTTIQLADVTPEDTLATPPAKSGPHGPVVHFPEPSHDFGTIPQGEMVSHTFIVRNVGDEPLKLIKAKGS